jgi:hypothetical protein
MIGQLKYVQKRISRNGNVDWPGWMDEFAVFAVFMTAKIIVKEGKGEGKSNWPPAKCQPPSPLPYIVVIASHFHSKLPSSKFLNLQYFIINFRCF